MNSESDEGELMAARLQHAISQLMIVREFAQNIDAPVEAKDVVHLVQQVPMAPMMVAGVQEFYGAVVGDAPTVRNNETAIPALAFTRRGKAAPIKGISFAAIEEVISRVADPRVVSLPFASPIPGHEAVVAKLRHIGRRVPLTGTANRGSITNNDDIANLHKLRPWLKPSESPCCKTRRPPQGGDGFHTIEFCENFPDVVLHRPVRSAAEHG